MGSMRRFLKNQDGATAIEYGLIAGLIAVLIIAGVTVAGTSLETIFNYIGDTLKAAAGKVPASTP